MSRKSSSTWVALAVALAAGPAVAQRPPLTLGIPAVYGKEHAASVGPVVEPYLTRVLGGPVKVTIVEDPDALASALVEKKLDLAWLTPLAFVHAVQKDRDVIALLKAMRNGTVVYRSALFVKAGSAATSLAQLKGLTAAWVGPASTSGYLYPRELVRQAGLDPDTLFAAQTFAGDHPAVCARVKSGAADVGATFAADPPDGGSEVRADGCGPDAASFTVVASTGNVPNEVIAARSDFPPKRINDVIAAFGRMSLSPEGQKVLALAFKADGFGAAVDGDFDGLVELTRLKDTRPRVPPGKARGKK